MNHFSLVRHGLIATLLFTSLQTFAAMPTNPVTDANFSTLPNGVKLQNIAVSGVRLSLTRGIGTKFTATHQASYEKMKADTLTNPKSKVQWAIMDLDAHRVLGESLNSNRKIFGASSSKIFVGGALMNKQNGAISNSQLQLMANMLVVSSNDAWVNLQSQVGDGNANTGRSRIHNFTQGLGLEKTRGYQGYWGNIHGNELTAAETVEYLHSVYKGDFPGSETLWKVMHACRTGASRGLKYLPRTTYVGGKTGTYDGSTVDPETGAGVNVAIRNHVLIFNVDGRQYGLTILSNSGSDEATAILAGGLFREFTGYKD